MGDSRWLRSSFVYVILIVAVIALWFTFVSGNGDSRRVDFSEVATDIGRGNVAKLVLTEGSQSVKVEYTETAGKGDATTRLPPETDIYTALRSYEIPANTLADVAIETKSASRWGGWLSALTFLL